MYIERERFVCFKPNLGVLEMDAPPNHQKFDHLMENPWPEPTFLWESAAMMS